MNTPNYVLDTQNKISSYLAKLAESLKESNQDFRNIGPSKRLHRHAEASGFDNWQQMLAKLQEIEFTSEGAASTATHLLRDAKSHYESLSTALEKDDREFFDDSVYASTAESVDLSFSLSSNTSLHLKVSISDLNVISGYVRTGGFGKPAIIHLDSEQVDKASITMSYKIKEAIFDVSVMNYE
jgi:hypothetical protein